MTTLDITFNDVTLDQINYMAAYLAGSTAAAPVKTPRRAPKKAPAPAAPAVPAVPAIAAAPAIAAVPPVVETPAAPTPPAAPAAPTAPAAPAAAPALVGGSYTFEHVELIMEQIQDTNNEQIIDQAFELSEAITDATDVANINAVYPQLHALLGGAQ